MAHYVVNLDADPPMIHMRPSDERCNLDAVPENRRRSIHTARSLQMLVCEGYYLCKWCFGQDEPEPEERLLPASEMENPERHG